MKGKKHNDLVGWFCSKIKKFVHSFKYKWNHSLKCTCVFNSSNNIVEASVKVPGKYGWSCCLIFTPFVQDFVGWGSEQGLVLILKKVETLLCSLKFLAHCYQKNNRWIFS